MKKRIKLSEYERSLGSWLYVILNVANDEKFNRIYVCKRGYIEEHDGPLWMNACKFCNMYNTEEQDIEDSCVGCPISKAQKEKGIYIADWCQCGDDSWYNIVCDPDEKYSVEERIRAALNICEVIAKELKKERNETDNQTKDTVL